MPHVMDISIKKALIFNKNKKRGKRQKHKCLIVRSTLLPVHKKSSDGHIKHAHQSFSALVEGKGAECQCSKKQPVYLYCFKEEKKEVDGHDFHTDGAHSNTSSGLGSAAESFFSASGLLLYLLRIDTRLSYKNLMTAPQEI